jgi:hypothetical protein
MFITLTIDTTVKKKKFDASKGWRKAVFTKKRSLWQKFLSWRKSLKNQNYKFEKQAVMF